MNDSVFKLYNIHHVNRLALTKLLLHNRLMVIGLKPDYNHNFSPVRGANLRAIPLFHLSEEKRSSE